jgi:hypothetical protein
VASHAASIAQALVLQLGLLLGGCAGLKTHGDPTDAAGMNLQGVWNGMSVNDCSPVQLEPSRCRAVERISFTMLRHNERSWGFYRCAPGTRPCYNQVDRGEIKYLELTGRMLWLRVMRDDHSSCLFDTIPSPDLMRGEFWCFQGSALIERGSWQVERVY